MTCIAKDFIQQQLACLYQVCSIMTVMIILTMMMCHDSRIVMWQNCSPLTHTHRHARTHAHTHTHTQHTHTHTLTHSHTHTHTHTHTFDSYFFTNTTLTNTMTVSLMRELLYNKSRSSTPLYYVPGNGKSDFWCSLN